MLEIKAEMTEEQAIAIAQFFKRMGWNEYRQQAINDEEAYNMRDAGQIMRDALAEVGIAPR